MPNWGLHINVAERIIQDGGIQNPYDFVIGSLLPDAPWLNMHASTNLRQFLHCHDKDEYNYVFSSPNLSLWLSLHKDCPLSSDLYKGILSHIILDSEINFLWELICKYVGGGLSYINGKFSARNPVYYKWRETRVFTQFLSNPTELFKKYRSYGLSEAATKELKTTFDLLDADLDKLPSSILSTLTKDIENTEGYIWYVPFEQYTAVVDTVVFKCRSLNKML